jgi:hypothetical protein
MPNATEPEDLPDDQESQGAHHHGLILPGRHRAWSQRHAEVAPFTLLAAYTQLRLARRLARRLAADLRRPWEKPTPPERLSPARVRLGFRRLRAKTTCPASAPKPSRPGPGRPPGRRNTHPSPHHDVHLATATDTRKRQPKKTKSTNTRPRRTG